MSHLKRCKVPKKLLGANISEVAKPKDYYQLWENSKDKSTVGIGNMEIDFPEDMDTEEEQWIAEIEKPGNRENLTDFTTFDEACDAVKKHLKTHKNSLYNE